MGLTKSLNKAISLSCSNYILRQDYDDISEPNRIEKLFEILNKYSDVAVCASNYFKINSNQELLAVLIVPEPF